MNKKAWWLTLTEAMQLALFAVFLIVLMVIIGGLYNSFSGKDKFAQNNLDIISKEIEYLAKNDKTTPIPFPVNEKDKTNYYLKSIRACGKNEDPSPDVCSRKVSELCLVPENEKKPPTCVEIEEGAFKTTGDIGYIDANGNFKLVEATGNIIISKDDKGFITIKDAPVS